MKKKVFTSALALTLSVGMTAQAAGPIIYVDKTGFDVKRIATEEAYTTAYREFLSKHNKGNNIFIDFDGDGKGVDLREYKSKDLNPDDLTLEQYDKKNGKELKDVVMWGEDESKELSVVDVAVINSGQIKVVFNKKIDDVSGKNFTIEGKTVTSATFETGSKNVVIIDVEGLEPETENELTITELLVDAKEQEDLKVTINIPDYTKDYKANLELDGERKVLKSDGADSVLVTFTLRNDMGEIIEDNDMEVAFSATYGSFAEKRVTVQNGKASVLYTSETLDVERDALLTATIVAASNKNHINKRAVANVSLVPSLENVENEKLGLSLVDVSAETADMITLYFNKEVDLNKYLKDKTKGEIDTKKLGVDVSTEVDNNYSIDSGKKVNVKGAKAVKGNKKALHLILDTDSTDSKVLTDNSRYAVRIQDHTGTVSTNNTKGGILTDARIPSILGVSVDGLNKVIVKFSESIEKTSAENLQNWIIDGIRLDDDKWGAKAEKAKAEKAKAEVGEFNTKTGHDTRHIVTIELGKDEEGNQIYFKSGDHSIQGANIGDWANLTDKGNNQINTQTLDFQINEDNEEIQAEVEVQSPEQYILKLNKRTNEVLDDEKIKLQQYNEKEEKWENVIKDDNEVIKVTPKTNNNPTEYKIELNQDWTVINETNKTHKNYYNYKYRLFIDEGVLTNASNGKTNEKFDLRLDGAMKSSDTISPKIENYDAETRIVTMSKPVKFPEGGDGLPTLAQNQEQIPQPTAQFIKSDESITINANPINSKFENFYDTEFIVEPSEELEPGKWKLVVRSISDDIGNTATSAEFEFEVESEDEVAQEFRVAWAAADSDNNFTNGFTELDEDKKDHVIYVKFTQPVSTTGGYKSALTTTNYTVNGKPLPKGTQIVANINGYDDEEDVIDSVTIILPKGYLKNSINTTVITVSPYIQNKEGKSVANGGQFKLPLNEKIVVKEKLEAAIKKAKESEKAEELKDEINKAQAVLDKEDATLEELNQAIKDLNKAVADAEKVIEGEDNK